jgi:hypothetical protein
MTLRKRLLTGLLSAALALASFSGPSLAGYKSHGYGHHYRHHGHYGHHGHNSDDVWIAAGIIGGAVLLGSLFASRPYYDPPPPRYYTPPPRPRCSFERVYRYLPDGRIQWGTRTTCY